MLEKINLLPKIEAIWEKKLRVQRLLQVGSLVLLIFYFVFLSSLFSYFLLLRGQDQSLQRKIKVYEERVKGLEPVESKQVFLKTKLTHLVKILSREERPEEILRAWENLALEGINLLGINYREEKVSISGEARDVLVLDQFVKKLQVEGRGFFSQAEFEKVSKTPEGDYNFNLSLIR